MRANVALFIPHNGCPHRCSFCDQVAITRQAYQPTPEDVRRTARDGLDRLGKGAADCELAFFGGSFTCLDRGYMVSLLEAAQPFLGEGGYRGIRVSTRPDGVGEDVLALLKRYGVSTVELGAQSLSDAVLALNSRGHTADDVVTAARRVRAAGLALGLQMMTGLPGDTAATSLATARGLAALAPDCVRIYPAIVLEHTQLAAWVADGRYTPPTLEETVALCCDLLDVFDAAGIPVIRLGLHTIDPAAYVAGPWHPAFGELVQSERWYRLLRAQIPHPGDYRLSIHPTNHSALVGQRRANLRRLAAQGIRLTVTDDPALAAHDMTVEEVKH